MGDCTIHLLVESKLLSDTSGPTDNDEFHLVPSSHVIAADSTLVEVTSLLSQTLSANDVKHGDLLSIACIIDASYHPAKIVNQTIREHPDKSGPKSKTLQSMGWFPSGKLVILQLAAESDEALNNKQDELLNKFIGWQSRHVLNEEEFAYNLPSVSAKDANGVQWAGVENTTAQVKPTDIFDAVQARFDGDQHINQIQYPPKTSQKKQKRSEQQQRYERLDAILDKLKKSKKTSVQVRNMLIKSRSVGDKKLRMEDRFHLEIVRVDDTTTESDTKDCSDYRFYSRQTTAGKVASSLAPSLGQNRSVEFLISVSSENEKEYRRLPNTMSLHDAQRDGWLNDFDTVVIRIYMLSGDGELVGASKSVLDAESEDEVECSMQEEAENEDAIDSSSVIPNEVASESNSAQLDKISEPLQQKLRAIFQKAEAGEIENKSNPTKAANKTKKSVSKQVQNMLIKSKASGDRKVKQEDRVYLELVVFHDSSGEVEASSLSSSYWFFEKRKTVGYVIDSQDVKKDGVDVEFIVGSANSDKLLQKLPADMKLMSAIREKVLDNFDRVILRIDT